MSQNEKGRKLTWNVRMSQNVLIAWNKKRLTALSKESMVNQKTQTAKMLSHSDETKTPKKLAQWNGRSLMEAHRTLTKVRLQAFRWHKQLISMQVGIFDGKRRYSNDSFVNTWSDPAGSSVILDIFGKGQYVRWCLLRVLLANNVKHLGGNG